MTVLISSHNLREVEDICDHVGILHKGSLLLEKELDDLKTDVHKIQIAFKMKFQKDYSAISASYIRKTGKRPALHCKGK